LVGTATASPTYCMFWMSDIGTFTGGSPTNGYTGSNKSVYVWGAQIEVAAFSSSYIPTTGTSATRARDTVAMAGSLNTILKSSQGSIVADVIMNASGALIAGKIVGDGNTGDSMLWCNFSNTLVSGTGFAGSTIGNSRTWDIGAKLGESFAAGAGSLVGGGGTVGTTATPWNDSGHATPLYLGTDSGGPCMYGYIRRVTVWNTKLADATLQALTAP
jgi:hypothetical protein